MCSHGRIQEGYSSHCRIGGCDFVSSDSECACIPLCCSVTASEFLLAYHTWITRASREHATLRTCSCAHALDPWFLLPQHHTSPHHTTLLSTLSLSHTHTHTTDTHTHTHTQLTHTRTHAIAIAIMRRSFDTICLSFRQNVTARVVRLS